jgi:hypothetical protein
MNHDIIVIFPNDVNCERTSVLLDIGSET